MIGRLLYLMIIGVLLFTVDGLGQNTWVKTFGGSQSDLGNSILKRKNGNYLISLSTYSIDSDFLDTTFKNMDKRSYFIELNDKGDLLNSMNTDPSDYLIPTFVEVNDDKDYWLSGIEYMVYRRFGWMDYGTLLINRFGTYSVDFGSSVKSNLFIHYNNNSILGFNTVLYPYGCFSELEDDTTDKFRELNTSIKMISWDTINLNNKNLYLLSELCVRGDEDDVGTYMIHNGDGFLITGNTKSNKGDFYNLRKGKIIENPYKDRDIFLCKFDFNKIGQEVYNSKISWCKIFGGTNNDDVNIIENTSKGDIYLSGTTTSNDGDFNGLNKGRSDVFVMKLDKNGDIIWKKVIGGTGSEVGFHNDEVGFSSVLLKTTSDGGCIVGGSTPSNDGDFSGMGHGEMDIFLTKLDSNGNILWIKTYGGTKYDILTSMDYSEGNELILLGHTVSNDGDFSGMNKGGSDIFVMKLDSNGNLNKTTSINEFSEPTTTLSVHPNPFSNSTTVSYRVEIPSNVRIELLNTLGQTIEVLREDYTDIGTYQLPLNVSTLSSGMYSVRMRSGSMNEVVPVWVVK